MELLALIVDYLPIGLKKHRMLADLRRHAAPDLDASPYMSPVTTLDQRLQNVY